VTNGAVPGNAFAGARGSHLARIVRARGHLVAVGLTELSGGCMLD
jgi:hypothetical protein